MNVTFQAEPVDSKNILNDILKREKKKAETNYIKTNRMNNLATGLLWAAAIVTFGILVYILGFILYRGFRSDNILEQDHVYIKTTETPLPWLEGDSVVIVNKDVRIKEISYSDLSGLIGGKPSNWGNINEQDLDVFPYLPDGAEGKTGKNMTFMPSTADIISAVASQKGGLGIISADNAETSDLSDVRILPVIPFSIAVNSSVLEIQNNIKIRFTDEDGLKALFSGKITNWQDAGGIDLAVTPIIPPAGSKEYDEYLRLTGLTAKSLPANAVKSTSDTDYIEKLNSTSGAVGLVFTETADELKLDILNYQYRKTGMNLQWWFLFEEPKRAGRVGGISSIVVNTIYMVLLTVLFSTPIGIGAAVYLTEYAKQGILIKILRLGTETLAGIPSIIFGLFGFIVFVGYMHLGIGLLSGTLTLTLMILPTIIRTAEEAIKGVPQSFRAGSLALGAGKWQTIYKVVIPAAAPGILTGVILAIGRAVGETAALLFTMGFDYRRAENLSTSARVLSTHLYQLVKEGISFDRAFATATILIVIILIVNVLSTRLIRRKY